MVKRRDFLKYAGIGGAAALTTLSTVKVSRASVRWKMVTSWPPKFPILQEGAELFAKRVEEMSGGRMKIDVFAAGTLIPALGGFDAISAGTVEMGSSASYYWPGKVPAAQFFTAVPYGFTFDEMTAWLNGGGGLELWNEIYAPFNLVAIPMLNTGVQMGGWFRKEIKALEDLKGLKMCIPGLGGKVMAKAGVSVVLLPGGERVPALEKGVVDAAEWVGPAHDLRLGFPKVAKFYYYPGWHEPGSQCELMINKKKWEELPKDLQAVVRAAAYEINNWSYSQFEMENAKGMAEIKKQFPEVKFVKFPVDVLKAFRKLTSEVLAEEAAADKTGAFKKVYDAYLKFRKDVDPWGEIAARVYFKAEELK